VPHLYLVDASPYVFRAYFALPDSITDPGGRPVQAAYGFAGFLNKLVEQEEPTHLAVTFDRSLTTSFRNDFYPDYKSSRELPPPELEAQIDDCLALARAYGAATFVDEAERYEADDLIAALLAGVVGEIESGELDATIVTSDKDLAQLVTDRVSLLDFAKDDRYGPAEVVEKFGVRPEQIVDFLALAGDPVDDIPGVQGVGKKTAQALLGAFPDLDTIYDRLDEVPNLDIRGAKSLAKKLAAARETAFLSQRLAVAATEACEAVPLDELRYDGAVAEELDPLFERLGFEKIRDRVPRWRG
jgi:5'-3' exonuclease